MTKAIWGRLQDRVDDCAIGVAVFLFHLWHVPAVAKGAMVTRPNLAFDFDVGRFVSLWGVSPLDAASNAAYYAVRHPLAIALRLVERPFVAAGTDPAVAAGSVAALSAAISSVLAFRIARTLHLGRPLAWVMTGLWTLSVTSLLLGVLPETYGLALPALSWQWLIAIRWLQGERPSVVARIAVAVLNLGITVTNVALAGLVELVCRLVRQPLRRAVAGAAAFGAAVAAIGLLLGMASFHVWRVSRITTPEGAARQLYWSAASADTREDRQSPAEVAWTFGTVAFAAPAIARYPTGVAEDPYLYDLRGRGYGLGGGAAALGWLALLLFGVAVATRDRAMRPLWVTAAAWAVGNVALHSYWQFRGAVFLYAAHPHMAIFLFALAGARWAEARGRPAIVTYAALAGGVTLLFAAANLPLYGALATLA